MALYLGDDRICPTIMPSTGGVNIPLEVSNSGALQKPTTSFIWSLPSNVTTITQNYTLSYAFRNCTGLTSLDLSNITTIDGLRSMYGVCYDCTNLTSVNLSNLTTISGDYAMQEAFNGCTNLTSVNLSNLTTIGIASLYATFSGCSNLTNVDLSSLTTLNGSSGISSIFQYCDKLTTLSFPSLTSSSFGSYTNQFYNMLYSVTGCTVHFPSNLQSVIGSWSDVVAGFGGTNTTVLFDLPATT